MKYAVLKTELNRWQFLFGKVDRSQWDMRDVPGIAIGLIKFTKRPAEGEVVTNDDYKGFAVKIVLPKVGRLFLKNYGRSRTRKNT